MLAARLPSPGSTPPPMLPKGAGAHVYTPCGAHIYARAYICPAYIRARIYIRAYIRARIYARASIYARAHTRACICARAYIYARLYIREFEVWGDANVHLT